MKFGRHIYLIKKTQKKAAGEGDREKTLNDVIKELGKETDREMTLHVVIRR